jgi:hypothetical protein
MKTSRELETIIESYLAADDALTDSGVGDLPAFTAHEAADARRALYLRPVHGPEDVAAKLRVFLGPLGLECGDCPDGEDVRALEMILAWAVAMLGQRPESTSPAADPSLVQNIVARATTVGS